MILKNGQENKVMWYFVEYNCLYIAMYKSIRACLNFIDRKKLQDDADNILRIWDSDGNLYNPINGRKL